MTTGDFARELDARRPRLRAIAYRMLGSLSDADDAVQEAWLRLQRADPAQVDNLDGWLTTAVARVCLNMIRDRRRHPTAPLDGFHPEPIVSEEAHTNPEQEALLADAVGMSMLVVLDTLSPAERIAFVLHDMFAVPFSEIALMIDRSPEAARQLASRARRRVRGAAPAPEPELARQRAVVDAYFAAAREGDLDALIRVLDPDVVLRAHRRGLPPLVLRGAADVARGATAARGQAQDVHAALVNGGAGVVAHREGIPFAVLAFSVVADRAVAIDIFNDPELVPQLIVRRPVSRVSAEPGGYPRA